MVGDARFGETYYIYVKELVEEIQAITGDDTIDESKLMDKDLFTFSVSKSTNGAIVKSVSRDERVRCV